MVADGEATRGRDDRAMKRVLTNATLIDCVNPRPIPGASVTIEDGRIAEVLDTSRAPDTGGAEVTDLGGAYLLPRLWDVHIHPDYLAATGASVVEQTVAFGHRLMEALTEGGVVGVRCAGAAHFMDVAWKRAFESGQYVGPRVFAAGYFLTTTGGHFLTSGHARECDGPYGFVRAIREQIKNGVDHIKLNLTGGIMGPAWDRHRQWFQQALSAGVKMALGSDIRPLKEAALLELGLWVKDGATPWQALLAATRHAAELCGVGDELGTIEPGKLADLIVVGANPLEEITNLRQLLLVLKEGRIVSDKRRAA